MVSDLSGVLVECTAQVQVVRVRSLKHLHRALHLSRALHLVLVEYSESTMMLMTFG